MDERARRIVITAMEMAEKDGYDGLRLRELSERAGVALGTVYRRFSSKEEILAAALELLVAQLRDQLQRWMVPGETPEERLQGFFGIGTQILGQSPKLSAAMLRTVSSGDPELSEKVLRYHDQMTELILAVYRGEFSEEPPSNDERALAELLQNVWFGALVGWTGGMHTTEVVMEQMTTATRLLLRGFAHEQPL